MQLGEEEKDEAESEGDGDLKSDTVRVTDVGESMMAEGVFERSARVGRHTRNVGKNTSYVTHHTSQVTVIEDPLPFT